MSLRLKENISSQYIEAANRMKSKAARQRIVAYVESYEDIFFWRTVLSRFEDDKRYIEVMLPSRGKLARGKKSVLNTIGDGVGRNMIACVDADYDYLLQGKTEQSRKICNSEYVFHTRVYAIENYQCYASGLHDVCVMVTLNDSRVFDFEDFFQKYSEAIFPLFVWSVWAYRTGNYNIFSLQDFCNIVDTGRFNLQNANAAIGYVRQKVGRKINNLQTQFPNAKEQYLQVKADILRLGVTPQTTYLFIQGHHLYDNVVVPMLTKICSLLRQEREDEIYHTSVHATQMRNELACYENSIADVKSMLRRSTSYTACPEFLRLTEELKAFFEGLAT